jgi:hypothetical protein
MREGPVAKKNIHLTHKTYQKSVGSSLSQGTPLSAVNELFLFFLLNSLYADRQQVGRL